MQDFSPLRCPTRRRELARAPPPRFTPLRPALGTLNVPVRSDHPAHARRTSRPYSCHLHICPRRAQDHLLVLQTIRKLMSTDMHGLSYFNAAPGRRSIPSGFGGVHPLRTGALLLASWLLHWAAGLYSLVLLPVLICCTSTGASTLRRSNGRTASAQSSTPSRCASLPSIDRAATCAHLPCGATVGWRAHGHASWWVSCWYVQLLQPAERTFRARPGQPAGAAAGPPSTKSLGLMPAAKSWRSAGFMPLPARHWALPVTVHAPGARPAVPSKPEQHIERSRVLKMRPALLTWKRSRATQRAI